MNVLGHAKCEHCPHTADQHRAGLVPPGECNECGCQQFSPKMEVQCLGPADPRGMTFSSMLDRGARPDTLLKIAITLRDGRVAVAYVNGVGFMRDHEESEFILTGDEVVKQ